MVARPHTALWTVSRTSSFRDAVLLAADLGEDADTTAVAGQITGAVYGASGIPADWLGKLAWRSVSSAWLRRCSNPSSKSEPRQPLERCRS